MGMKFKLRNKIFEVKPLLLKNIDMNYVKRTNNQYIESNTNSINSQKNYIKNIRKNGNQVYQITNEGRLTATSGFQFLRKKTFQGLLIIDNNFLNKGFAKYFIFITLLFANKTKGKLSFYANINKDNISSIKSFTAAGYKIIKKNKNSLNLFFNLSKINIKSSINKNIKIIK